MRDDKTHLQPGFLSILVQALGTKRLPLPQTCFPFLTL